VIDDTVNFDVVSVSVGGNGSGRPSDIDRGGADGQNSHRVLESKTKGKHTRVETHTIGISIKSGVVV
jgi:hypothetical protein